MKGESKTIVIDSYVSAIKAFFHTLTQGNVTVGEGSKDEYVAFFTQLFQIDKDRI